ncbi:biotin carboxylase [Bradyrhizobium japonicum]
MTTSAAIFIESNTSGSGADFIKCARELGLRPILITTSPERYRFFHGDPKLEVRICDTSSEAAVTAAVDEIALVRPIGLLTTSSDLYLHIAALQAERLGLAGPDPNVIALCRDKARQAAALRAEGIVVPCSAAVGGYFEIPNAIARVGLPAVVKPISGTGSIGVSLVETEAEAIQALRNLLETTINVRGCSIQAGALLMSYIVGDEFSVEILDGRVICVTRKHLGPLPHFVEIGHDVPAMLSPDLRTRIVGSALRAIEVLGHTQGAAHVELRAYQDCAAIIEVNPRLAGGSIPSLLRHALGFDPVRAVLLSLLGMPSADPSADTHGAIRFIVPDREGRFDLPQKSDRLIDRFGLAEFALYRALPTHFERCNDFRDRIGHVITVDDDPVAAVRRAEAAVRFIRDEGE